jgi:hypothetical protein
MAQLNLDQWIGVVGSLIGIIGICLAIFYGRKSEKRRIPTFVEQPGRDLLCRKILTAFPNFLLTHGGQSLAGSDVVGFRVQFWNSGNLPILDGEILKPFTFSLPAECQILNTQLVMQSRDEVKARITVSERTIALSFAVLEPDDGVNIQVIYAGPTDAALDFQGACLGAATPKVLQGSDAIYTPLRERFSKFIKGLALPVSIAVLFFITSEVNHYLPRKLTEIVTVIFEGALGLLALASILFVLWGSMRMKNVPRAITKITK